MANPFNESDPVRKTYFINESEKAVDPADDEGKVPQLEGDGKISEEFVNTKLVTRIYNLVDSPATWTKPTGLKRAAFRVWGGGGSGGARSTATLADYSTGGSGGSFVEITLNADDIPASLDINVGAGGVGVTGNSVGNDGNPTTVGDLITALGGKGGDSESSTILDYKAGVGLGAGDTVNKHGQFWGSGSGGSASGTSNEVDSGGDAFLAGAGGGGLRSGDTIGAGGVSALGGNGGDGNGEDGVVPAGGGGANHGSTSGKGGDGQVQITEFY